MDQPPPSYDASITTKTTSAPPVSYPSYPGTQTTTTAPPVSYPSYPGTQTSPSNYPAPSVQYGALSLPVILGTPQIPLAQHSLGQQYPLPLQRGLFSNNLFQSGFGSPGAYDPSPLPQSTVNVPGQLHIPTQEQQFMSSGPNQQQQPLIPPVPNQFGMQEMPAQLPQNEASAPTAPSLDQMDKVPGYENVTFGGGSLPPPPPDPNARGREPIRVDFSNFPSLTTEDAREALLTYVGEHCCYGKRAARNMALNNIKNTAAIHYKFETFSERRETLWAFEPYAGQVVDGPANGQAPGPWKITMPMGEPYKENILLTEVPHTASVKQCHDCEACGRKKCYKCLGYGWERCRHCYGRGHRGTGGSSNRCSWCWGRGQITCTVCNGNGQIVCTSCDGKLQLKWFIQLKSIWKVHSLDYIIERTPMPDDLVRTVTGQDVFEEDVPRVWPITNFPDEELNATSANFVQQHNAIQETERMVSQRHKVRIVPVAQVSSTWKGKNDDFYVYGFENKIYSPNYPQQQCCGCSIL